MTTDETERTVYEIPEANYPRFMADIEKLSRKSVKLIGLPIKPLLISREPKEIGKGKVITVCRVSLMAEAPVLDGWTFVATLDHSHETGNIVRTVPNVSVEVPARYRTVEPFCDHCQVLRRRRDTYLLWKRETGEFQQVGSTCLKDFLGGHDPYAVARMAEWLGQANEVAQANQEFDEERNTTMRDNRWISVDDLVAYSAMSIRRFGWVSSKRAAESEYEATRLCSTRDNAFYCMRNNQGPEFRPTPEDRKQAEEALEWARSLSERDDLDNYEHSLSVVSNSLYCEYRHTALVASVLTAYQNHLDRTRPSANVWLGQKGRVIHGEVRVARVLDISNRFGPKTKVIFRAVKGGACLTWETTVKHGLVQGAVVDLRGTVKDHNEYRGTRQTAVERCQITKVEG